MHEQLCRLLTSKVQVTQTLFLPSDKKVHVSCQLNSNRNEPTGLIESLMSEDPNIMVAVTLDTSSAKREVVARL